MLYSCHCCPAPAAAVWFIAAAAVKVQVTANYTTNQTELISFEQIRQFQLESAVHVCPSEREVSVIESFGECGVSWSVECENWHDCESSFLCPECVCRQNYLVTSAAST